MEPFQPKTYEEIFTGLSQLLPQHGIYPYSDGVAMVVLQIVSRILSERDLVIAQQFEMVFQELKSQQASIETLTKRIDTLCARQAVQQWGIDLDTQVVEGFDPINKA